MVTTLKSQWVPPSFACLCWDSKILLSRNHKYVSEECLVVAVGTRDEVKLLCAPLFTTWRLWHSHLQSALLWSRYRYHVGEVILTFVFNDLKELDSCRICISFFNKSAGKCKLLCWRYLHSCCFSH